ncbi:Ldh family oxidoreductase [Cochlodiniinecator piscidefendens]|uniref:Ldh family oxidoreductase n=1 Tax=Cochlodiniinecator piscidefendens TaxID=2715756 RepID=UPI00140DD56F
MTTEGPTGSKLDYDGERISVGCDVAIDTVHRIMELNGCTHEVASEVAEHLVESDLSGVESHGVMRALKYAEFFQNGRMNPRAVAQVVVRENGVEEIDGQGGIGIPAMRLAAHHSCARAKETGMAALALRNVGHTGRLGAFAEYAANEGCLMIIVGGGGRQNWRQVAPYGGRKALLPTNPYCIGIPGGDRGPVVLDFATSQIAGGWIYAAQSAGAQLPEGALINKDGYPSRDPNDYFNGGAILPSGGPKGYALSVMAEMICEAMLGPVTTECNWMMITLDTSRYRAANTMQAAAEEVLSELRNCPTMPGFARVEIPGEREADQRTLNRPLGLQIPAPTWSAIVAASGS